MARDFIDPDQCIFCGAWGCETETAEHAKDCPFSTGLWPVTGDPNEEPGGIHCCECHEEIAPGDCYVHTRTEDSALGRGHYMGVRVQGVVHLDCLGCGAEAACVGVSG